MIAALLAFIVDPFFVIVVVFFLIIPLIGVLTSKMRDAMQPPRQPPTGQPGGPRIQEQIDEFLRRAAQRRAGSDPGAAGKAAAGEQPVDAEVVDDDDEPVGDRVVRQSNKFLDTSDFRRRSEHLGEEVVQSDQQFTQQVKQGFSGEIDRLSARRGETAEPTQVQGEPADAEDPSRPTLDALPVAGSGLGELLGDSDAIVQAIIMSEILRRPDWDAR